MSHHFLQNIIFLKIAYSSYLERDENSLEITEFIRKIGKIPGGGDWLALALAPFFLEL